MNSRGDLYDAIGRAGDIRSIARELGRFCLFHRVDLQLPPGHHVSAQRLRTKVAAAIEAADVRALPPDAHDFGARLVRWLGQHAHAELGLLDGNPGLGAHGVLKGLCRRPLAKWFGATTEQIEVRYGDPIPAVTRLFPDPDGRTPLVSTLLAGTLLGEEQFVLYHGDPPDTTEADSRPGLEVVMDFSARALLDEVVWDTKGGRFHRLTTIHPHSPSAIDPKVIHVDLEEEWWFGVWPQSWDEDAIVNALVAARKAGATVAVLPEMSLPHPDALEQRILARSAEIPRLIVAGSAHEPFMEVPEDLRGVARSNRSVVYLDGSVLFEHRKIFPFRTRHVGPKPPLAKRLPEGLDNGVNRVVVASGTNARVAVVICSDLHDDGLTSALRSLCVNLLLVPTLTPTPGKFEGEAAVIAGSNQGTVLLANGSAPDAGPPAPYLVLLAVPREGTGKLTAMWETDEQDRRMVAIIDPNRPADAAVIDYAPFDAPNLQDPDPNT